MDIEAVIAEATTVAPQSEATSVATDAEAPQEPIVKEEVKNEENLAVKPDSELTPEQLAKREANRSSRQNRYEAKMRRENRQLKETLAKLTAQASQPAPQAPASDGRPVKPNAENYQDWDTLQADTEKYYEQLAEWKVEQKLSERDKKSEETQKAAAVDTQRAQWVNEQRAKTQEFGKNNPEYFELVAEHEDFLASAPEHIELALMNSENAQLALFALMKEGSLEELEDMSPAQVIREIAKAEIRGEQYLNRNKATNAPSPVESARGTGKYGKQVHELSVEELLKRFN